MWTTWCPIWIMRLADASHGLTALGWNDAWSVIRDRIDAVGEPARVVRHDGIKVLASLGSETVHATFPRAESIAVGDWVLIDQETVTAVLPRISELNRDLGDHGTQLIAANVDLVLLVFGVDREIRRAKVLRFLSFAWDIGVEPAIVLTKADLGSDIPSLIATMRSWDVSAPIVAASIDTGEGLDEVAAQVHGKTVALIGESGAGKSSLVNALMRDDVAWVGEVRERDRRGRHTTTHRELHIIPTGGLLIDNPGIRSLGLAGDSTGVEDAFSDIEALAGSCRFRDCEHDTEPDCSVLAATKSGEITVERLAAYRRLRSEQHTTADRVAQRQRRSDRRADARAARTAREQADADRFEVS